MVMGPSYFGPSFVEHVLGPSFTPLEWWKLGVVPYPIPMLYTLRATHVLVATPAVTFNDLYRKLSRDFFTRTMTPPWTVLGCLLDPMESEWNLVRKRPDGESRGLPLDQQQALLGSGEFTPSATLAAFASLMYHRRHGVWLYDWNVRTASEALDGSRVLVGGSTDGLTVNFLGWDSYRDFPGLATAISPNRT